MLIQSLAGLRLVRRRLLALGFGSAMGEPLRSGVAFGLAACGPLAGEPEVYDLSHSRTRRLPNARW